MKIKTARSMVIDESLRTSPARIRTNGRVRSHCKYRCRIEKRNQRGGRCRMLILAAVELRNPVSGMAASDAQRSRTIVSSINAA